MRSLMPLSLYAVVALALVTHGTASAQTIETLQPDTGAVLTCIPLDLEVDLDAAADHATFAATLNGEDVSGSFSFDPPAAGRRFGRADDVWGSFVACDAGNSLDVSVELAGSPAADQAIFDTEGDPYADAVDTFVLGAGAGFNSGDLGKMLGAPLGGGPFQGSLDVVSLGTGGSVILAFQDNVVVDGPGPDFTVFENTFLVQSGGTTGVPFSEPGRVSVSQDKETWYVYPCAFDDPGNAPYWPGCAGVYPVLTDGSPLTPHASIPTDVPVQDLVGVPTFPFPLPAGAGGDSFDLAGSGLSWVRYVRIEAAAFDTGLPGGSTAGFDVEAVAAIHSAPEPLLTGPASVPALSPGAFALLAATLGWLGARRRVS